MIRQPDRVPSARASARSRRRTPRAPATPRLSERRGSSAEVQLVLRVEASPHRAPSRAEQLLQRGRRPPRARVDDVASLRLARPRPARTKNSASARSISSGTGRLPSCRPSASARSSRPTRGRDVASLHRPPRRPSASLAARRRPGAARPRPSSSRYRARLLEVVAEDLVQLDETGAVFLEPDREPLVQLGPGRLRQRRRRRRRGSAGGGTGTRPRPGAAPCRAGRAPCARARSAA